MWTNANLVHPTDELLPGNYALLIEHGKLLVKWYKDPAFPRNNFFRDERFTQKNGSESDFP